MPDDKKDVAKKLQERIQHFIRLFEMTGENDAAERLRVGIEHNGMSALVKIFSRQLSAQFEAHGLKEEEFFPVVAGQEIVWDDAWTRYMTMWLDAMIDEIEETRNWLNWKCWKKPVKMTENTIENARLELIDLLHFWINAYYMLGGTPESLVAEYHAKRDENDNRQKEGY